MGSENREVKEGKIYFDSNPNNPIPVKDCEVNSLVSDGDIYIPCHSVLFDNREFTFTGTFELNFWARVKLFGFFNTIMYIIRKTMRRLHNAKQ